MEAKINPDDRPSIYNRLAQSESPFLSIPSMTQEEKNIMAAWVAAVISEMYDTSVFVNDAGRAIVSVFDAHQKASLTGATIQLPDPISLVRELESL